jgi:hypothetical protein
MTSISKESIEDRVARFVEYVRAPTHVYEFEPNKDW